MEVPPFTYPRLRVFGRGELRTLAGDPLFNSEVRRIFSYKLLAKMEEEQLKKDIGGTIAFGCINRARCGAMKNRKVRTGFQGAEHRVEHFSRIGEIGENIFRGWKSGLAAALCMLCGATGALANGYPIYYVDAVNGSDANDGGSWATAKQTIQDAVNNIDTNIGTLVLVTNGVYDLGGAVTPGYALTNRVMIKESVIVRSVNGPEVTIIKGAGPAGPAAVRGVYLSAGAQLIGFTITNGYTMTSGAAIYNQSGAGLWMTNNSIASNCIVQGNTANNNGGGAYLYYGGTLNNCTLNDNSADNSWGGGVYTYFGGTLSNCTVSGNSAVYGAGAYIYHGGTFNNCIVRGNTASDGAGGAALDTSGTMNNCLVFGNSAANYVGGVEIDYAGDQSLNNCTIAGNSVSSGCGGVYLYQSGILNNCIVFGNSGTTGTDIYLDGGGSTLRNTCASDGVTDGVDGCITNNPMLNADYTLSAESPCFNTGDNTYAPAGTDLAGKPRIAWTTVDMGAYELHALISPSSGPFAGGNTITVTNASDFGAITNIIVGSPSVGSAIPTDSGSNWFTITLPATTNAGTVSLTVQTSDNGDTVLPNAYTYNPSGSIGTTAADWSRWSEVVGLPAARHFAAPGVVPLDGYLYAVGGGFNGGAQTNVYRFDGTQWDEVMGLPQATDHSTAAAMDGTIYYFRLSSGNIVTYGFDGSTWTTVPGGSGAGQSQSTMGTWGTNMYLMGGFNSVPKTNTYMFNGVAYAATKGIPSALFSSASATLNDRMYLMSGVNGSFQVATNVYSFDGTDWTEVAGMPAGRYVAGAATFSNHIYMVGGGTGGASPYTNVFRFDGTNWAEIAGLPAARKRNAVGVLNNVLYSVGGVSSDYTTFTNVYRYPALTTLSGVSPDTGSLTGGYQVIITGSNLGNGSDITNVTLCGVAATNIASQSSTQVVVWAGSRGSAATGEVVVFSTSYGATTKADSFAYTGVLTRVVLYDFYMQVVDGGVSVCWQTASEEQTANFDLYRRDGEAWVKVNAAPIPGTGELGGSYCVADPLANASDSFTYKLVEQETDGGVQEYGPFEVSARNPRLEHLAVTPEGIVLRWLSREQDTYEVQKSVDIRDGFLPVATGLPATPPVNEYIDEAGIVNGAFYRVRAEE